MSSPQSPYHVLRRLLSICHNAPLETATFYASLLHDLFAEDLLTGTELEVQCLREDGEEKGKSDVVMRKIAVDPHLAIHLRAWIHIAAKEYYAAIHLVRERVYHRASTRKGKERATDSDAFTLALPFDGNRQLIEGNHESCLECAMIMAEACQSLGRFEEGRKILHHVHQATSRASSNPNLCITLAKPNAFPTSSALRLAQLSAQANHERMERIYVDSEGNSAQPDAIRFYEVALRDDPWLWEAWRGICDFGGHAQTFAPFSDEHINLPLLPFPTDLLPGIRDIPELHHPNIHANARSPSEASSPTEQPSNASSTTTASIRRMSPLPSTSPAAKATLLGRNAAPTGMMSAGPSFATPVTSNAEAPPIGHQVGKKAARRPPPPPAVNPKSRGYGRLSPSIDDMSFPDLTFSQSEPLPTTLFPSNKTDYRTPASVSHPLELPSIASRLFPGAKPVEGYAPGIGQPPALKRARNGDGKAGKGKGTLSRNATGRKASGNGLPQRFENLEEKPVRRSSRINGAHFKEPTVTPELFHKISRSQSRHADDPVTSSEEPEATSPQAAYQIQQQRAADLWLLRIVQRCAAAYNDACKYHCKTAISVLNTLPGQLRRGAWATGLYARCYYELADYRNANISYEHLRRIEPYRLEGLEWYSTVLWHLEDRAGLSVLAQQLMAISRTSAEPWMAAGNGFALQGEHEEALRCFKRASGCAPGKPYGYTLAAYEAWEMDEYERAIAHYQLAVRADVRHYHAWFGLGRVYQKMGKTRFAEYHFRRALEINPSNVVLYCCVGTIVEKRGDLPKALELYEQALEIAPGNKMARFRKVRVMIGMKQYDKALPLLEELSKTCSNEASVMFLLGKLYRLMGDRTSAMRTFIYARDLHPKLAGAIASVMKTGEEEEGDEEAEAEAVREGL